MVDAAAGRKRSPLSGVLPRIREHNLTLVAAGVAFYAFLAFVPAIVAFMSVYGLVADPADVTSQVEDVASALPKEVQDFLVFQLTSIANANTAGVSLTLLVAVVLALWSASGGISNLLTAVNVAYDEEEKRGFVKKRLLSLGLTLAAIVFMVIAAINFATHFLAWRRVSPRPYRRDPEAKAMLLVLALSVLLVAGYLFLAGVYDEFGTALRYAAFNVVSLATTTGYANTDYGQWPIFAPLVMLFLSSFVSCSGSTGSGMKMIRAQILFKQIFRELLRTIHPRVYNPVKLSEIPLSNATVFAVLAYLFMYTSSVVVLTLLLTASGLDVISGFSAAVASLNNTGPGLGEVGPATTYANLTDTQTWICSFAMLLGRLELLTLLVVFTPAFWRK